MAIAILPRNTWTSTAPGFPRYPSRKLSPSTVIGAALHYPAMGASVGKLTRAQEAAYWRGFRNFHVNTRGWADIGYNFGVTQAGRIYELAGDTHAAAHAASSTYPLANHHYIGICLLLGDRETPTSAMIASVNALLAHERTKYNRMRELLGHGQVRGALTACPGAEVLAAIAARRFRFPSPTRPAPAPTPPSGEVDSLGRYTVAPGDTLSELAARFRTSVGALVVLNGISDPDRIGVGDRLFTRWVVGRGDTLSGIADAVGTSVERLVALNGIKNPDVINVGQLLRLP